VSETQDPKDNNNQEESDKNQNQEPQKEKTEQDNQTQKDQEINQEESEIREETKINIFEDTANVKMRNITEEMEKSYLEYAMSVIISRALPDVRDGLKPVHRRILYVMNKMGLKSNASFRKSAAIVGDVMGKYHPHGDSAIYDSMVRMAQDFSLRCMLVKGQGNFGSIDGDSAAAMRYTEAKMQKVTDEMMEDIDKETVDWKDNYDGTLQEPKVLPTKLPQLLLNGTTGIAVGMATSIPPHNLGELIDGIIHLSNNPDATLDDLMEYIKGPDFPLGGILYNTEDIRRAYATGRGGMVVRSKTEIVERKGGKFAIIVTEIPYMVNKANLITKIAELVRDKKITGITYLGDESNKEGIRVVIELKKDSYPQKILNQLFKHTQLQSSFNMNMIALVDVTQPKLLDLKQVLEHFIKHRIEVITRRTLYELKIAKARAHILEGLKIALDNIDEVIKTIRASQTKEEALEGLISKFKLSELQAKAILEMRLQTLAGLERQKIENELAEKLALIGELESILADEEKIRQIMIEELAIIKEKYADPRRTEIIPHALGSFSQKDTIPNEPIMVVLSRENYIKRVSIDNFRTQRRGGKGVVGGTTKEEDEIKLIRYAHNHDDLLYFTNQGRVFKLPVYEIPKSSRQAKGQAIVNLLNLQEKETITAILKMDESFKEQYLFMATKNGTIKKTPVEEFKKVRKNGLIAIKLREGDSLEWVKEVSDNNEILIVTKEGKCIRFNEKNARPMGRATQGVRGIRLKAKDTVVEMDVVKDPEKAELLVVMENGLGKMTAITNYRFQGRGGTGVKTASLTNKTGKIVGAKIITNDTDADLVLISKAGQIIRLNTKEIPSRGRATQGVYLMRMKAKDPVASISMIENIKEDATKENKEENEKQETLVS